MLKYVPLEPHFYKAKPASSGVYIVIFLVFARSLGVLVLVRMPSTRHFWRIPADCVLGRDSKVIKFFCFFPRF